MAPLWEEMRAAFTRSSDTRMVVVGGLAGGVGGAVGALVETANIYARLALTGTVAVVVALALLAVLVYLDARTEADPGTAAE